MPWVAMGVRAAGHAAVGFPCGGKGGSTMGGGNHLEAGSVRGKDGTEVSRSKQAEERAWQEFQFPCTHTPGRAQVPWTRTRLFGQ